MRKLRLRNISKIPLGLTVSKGQYWAFICPKSFQSLVVFYDILFALFFILILYLCGSFPKLGKFSGIPWWSSGSDSKLPLLRAQLQSLVGELKSHKPRGAAKKKIREIFTHYSFKYFFWSFLLLLSFWDSNDMNVRSFGMLPQEREGLCSSYPHQIFFFPLLFRLDNFHWFVFECTDFFFCYIHSAIQSIWETFYFGYCIFLVQHCIWFFLYLLFLCWDFLSFHSFQDCLPLLLGAFL